MSKPLKPVDVDVSKIHIDPLKKKTYKNGQETKQCRIAYDFGAGVKKELNVRTPLATVPYGLSIAKENEGEAPRKFKKYSLDFEVVGTPELDSFRNKMKDFDNKNIDFITANALAWWGKTQSGKPWTRDTVQDTVYGSLIKKTDEEKGDFPERFKLKLPFYEGMPRFVVYDQYNKKINWVTLQREGEPPILDWSWAQRNMRIEAIAECEALWEVNKKVYCTFKALQVKVYPPTGLKENEFADDDSPVESSVASVPSVSSVTEKLSKVKVEDDDEDADEAEEAGEEEAEQRQKKKLRKRKSK
jgi:hypothetical protein